MSVKSKYNGDEKIDLSPWDGPPYSYSVRINGKERKMMGFDDQHILDQLHPLKASRITKLKAKLGN